MIRFSEAERHELAGFLRRVVPRGYDEAERLEQYIISLERKHEEEQK